VARLVLIAPLLGGGLKAAPTSSTTVAAAADYPLTCHQANECAPVFQGDVRDCSARPGGPNAAIGLAGQMQYYEDYNAKAGPCLPDPDCPVGYLACPKGQCQLHRASRDAAVSAGPSAADYSRACTEVADCVSIYAGPVGCCTETCDNAAINVADLPRYKTDFDHAIVACFPPEPCRTDTCLDRRVDCDKGKCVLLPARDGGAR
jgi:hypothetical protein